MRILRDAGAKLALLVRPQKDYAPVLLDGAEDEHLRREGRDPLWREVDHRQHGTADKLLLRVPRSDRRRRPLHTEGPEVDRELVRRVARFGEILHRQNAPHPDVDLAELVPREHGNRLTAEAQAADAPLG